MALDWPSGPLLEFPLTPRSEVMIPSARPRSPRVDRRRRRNREALLRAARRLMAERGFEGTTIADITEAADLGFGTFYLYFQSKEDVLRAVLDEGFGRMLKRVRDPRADSLPPWEALRFVTSQFVRAARENTDLFLIVFRHGRDQLAPIRSFGDAFSLRLQDVLERGIGEAAMRPVPTALVARALAGLYVQALLWRGESGPRPADEILETLFPLVQHGLANEGEDMEAPP